MSDNNTIRNTGVKNALAEDQANNNMVAQQMMTLMKLVEERERLSLEREKIALEREKVSASLSSEREKITLEREKVSASLSLEREKLALEKEKLFVTLMKKEMASVTSDEGSTDEHSSAQSTRSRRITSTKRVSAASDPLNSMPDAKRAQVEDPDKQGAKVNIDDSSPPRDNEDNDGDSSFDGDGSGSSESRASHSDTHEQQHFTFFVRKPNGTRKQYRGRFDQSIKHLFKTFERDEGVREDDVRFMLAGRRLQPTDTFLRLGLTEGDIIDAVFAQTGC